MHIYLNFLAPLVNSSVISIKRRFKYILGVCFIQQHCVCCWNLFYLLGLEDRTSSNERLNNFAYATGLKMSVVDV